MPQPKDVYYCLLGNIPVVNEGTPPPDPVTTPIVGSETGKTRPVIVLSVFPQHEIATVIPVTHLAENIADAVTVIEFEQNSWSGTPADAGRALVHQIRSVSYHRLDSKIGVLTDDKLYDKLKAAIAIYLKLKGK
jgi:mRNA-degrading endonuclease toxin of MazEF toxin-antitoxin module